MTRSSRATRTQWLSASQRAWGYAPRDLGITQLGITCFRLVALDDAAHSFAPIPLASMTAAMAAFAWPREGWRERYPRRVTAMDRAIRNTLALPLVTRTKHGRTKHGEFSLRRTP